MTVINFQKPTPSKQQNKSSRKDEQRIEPEQKKKTVFQEIFGGKAERKIGEVN